MARGRRGDGTIFQRKDGKWVAQFDTGYTRTGNRRRKTIIADTKTTATRRMREAMRAHHTGETSPLAPNTTVKTWAAQWLELRAATLRPQSLNADRSATRRWIIPTIGHKTLATLTPADVRKIHQAMRGAGKADTSITRAHATLKKMLSDAYQEGHPVPQRVLTAPPPATGEPTRTDIPITDAIKLIHATEGDPMRSRWVAALLQGMRQAECMGLTWDAVDFERETIEVSVQLKALPYQHGCGGTCGMKTPGACPQRRFRVPVGYQHEQIQGDRWHLVAPKTRAGVRTIPMLPWMKAALLERRELAPGARLVWALPDGRVRDDKIDSREWKALQDKAGVRKPGGEYYDLHECRHATATILLTLGIDPVVVIALMGHSSILSTRRYQHADLTLTRKALEGVAHTLQLDN